MRGCLLRRAPARVPEQGLWVRRKWRARASISATCCLWLTAGPLGAQAYLDVGPRVARLGAYLGPLARHLLHSKLRHWEKQLRELAARALAGGRLLGGSS